MKVSEFFDIFIFVGRKMSRFLKKIKYTHMRNGSFWSILRIGEKFLLFTQDEYVAFWRKCCIFILDWEKLLRNDRWT